MHVTFLVSRSVYSCGVQNTSDEQKSITGFEQWEKTAGSRFHRDDTQPPQMSTKLYRPISSSPAALWYTRCVLQTISNTYNYIIFEKHSVMLIQ